MKSFSRRSLLKLPAAAALPWAAAQPAGRAPLPRRDCYLGMHFDLHPNKSDKVLGRDLTEAMVEKFLDRVKPDYVQYDCKGHAGWLGYRSKVSPSPEGIVQDSLAIWRKVTKQKGVGLFVHFSGVWDSLAIEQHPEWARIDALGKRDERQTSTFGPYVDERMIPQLIEAAGQYDLDGAWVDGECWQTNPDYSPRAIAAFRKAYPHYTDAPRTAKDAGWQEFLEFNREQFRRYVRHYIEAVKAKHPRFQVASNWLYSTYVPERPELPVEFVSGDYLGNASISTARVEARYLAAMGKPWDLMAWGFQSARNNPVGLVHKPAVQLEQEAAVVLAQGGGFQVYYQPTRAGYLDERLVETMAKVARFCRDRQAWCHKSETVPQMGMLFSKHSLYTTSGKLFGGWPGSLTDAPRGLMAALVESRIPADVIPDWRLDELASQFPAIAVPDWDDIGEAARARLAEYVKSGGKLLLAGAANAEAFAPVFGWRLRGKPEKGAWYVPGSQVFGNASGIWLDIDEQGLTVLARRYPTYDATRDGRVAAFLMKAGTGEVAVIPGPAGAVFARTHAPAVREFIESVAARLWQPALRVEGPPVIETALKRKNGKLVVHLLNATNMQVAGDYSAFDFVPPVGPVRVSLRLPKQPAAVTLEPGGKAVNGAWRDGVWTGAIERLELHSMLVFS